MCKVHSVLWKLTVRSAEASLHGNRQMFTKTSHHSLRETSAGIVTPIVRNDWWVRLLDPAPSDLLSGVMNLTIEFQCDSSEAWGVVIEYWWFTRKWYNWVPFHLLSSPRTRALLLLQIRIWHDLIMPPACEDSFVATDSQQLYFSFCKAALPANEEDGEHGPSWCEVNHGCRGSGEAGPSLSGIRAYRGQ